jgi:hypothetical protein
VMCSSLPDAWCNNFFVFKTKTSISCLRRLIHSFIYFFCAIIIWYGFRVNIVY